MTEPFAIRCENLTKSYPLYERRIDRFKEAFHPRRKKYHHDFYALKDVSFKVKRGEAVGIVGQNGSGKSTLLKILSGVLTPTSGKVEVRGRVGALLELGTGFNPELTGMENLYFAGTLMGLTRSEIQARKDLILAFADIGEFIEQPVKTYSSGMLMRLAFAVQTSFEPDILIVDEALSVGDIFFQAKCLRRIRAMLDKGTTVFFVTHSLSALKELCSRALLLDHGSLLEDGGSSGVIQRYLRLVNPVKAASVSGVKETCEEFVETPAVEGEEVSQTLSAAALSELLDGRDDFLKSAGHERVQGGQAEFLNVALLDGEGNSSAAFDFGQTACCRMLIRVYEPVAALWVGYKIRTVTGVDIIHADSSLYRLLRYPFKSGKTYVAEWFFEMNLCHGDYLLGAALGVPDPPEGLQRTMHYADLIPIARTFSVQPRASGMIGSTAVWNNELTIKEVLS